MDITIAQQQEISGMLTTILGAISAAGIASSILTQSSIPVICTTIVAFIVAIANHFNTATTTTATSTTASTSTVAVASATAAATVTVTGPWDGNTVKTSKIGTRVLISTTLAFQLIDDRIATNFIVGGGGANALAAPSPWTFSGNLALISYDAVLY